MAFVFDFEIGQVDNEFLESFCVNRSCSSFDPRDIAPAEPSETETNRVLFAQIPKRAAKEQDTPPQDPTDNTSDSAHSANNFRRAVVLAPCREKLIAVHGHLHENLCRHPCR
mgnify:CR=1 FL=1